MNINNDRIESLVDLHAEESLPENGVSPSFYIRRLWLSPVRRTERR